MGGKPSQGTSKDMRLKENQSTSTGNKPAAKPGGVSQEKFNQERGRQRDGGVTTKQS